MAPPATPKEPPFCVPDPADNTPAANPTSPPNADPAVRAVAQAAVWTGAQNQPQKPSSPTDLCTVQTDTKYWSYKVLRPRLNIQAFLEADLDVSRLNDIYDHLWWAGRRVPPRPLHRLKMLGRQIAITEQADLHLVWSVESVFVKPLPDFLLDHSFWKQHICQDDHSQDIYESARGFVLSYVWLIRHKSDFEIAKSEWLLPDDLTWPQWRDFVESVWDYFGDLHKPQSISKRYRYGELRVSRLNQIYRFAPRFFLKHLLRGYLYSYSSYGGFFTRQFAWLIVAFAYLSIILSAMQVGLSTPQLADNNTFNRASYGFAVASIMLPAVTSAVALVLYVVLWIYHVSITFFAWLGTRKKERQQQNNNPTTGAG